MSGIGTGFEGENESGEGRLDERGGALPRRDADKAQPGVPPTSESEAEQLDRSWNEYRASFGDRGPDADDQDLVVEGLEGDDIEAAEVQETEFENGEPEESGQEYQAAPPEVLKRIFDKLEDDRLEAVEKLEAYEREVAEEEEGLTSARLSGPRRRKNMPEIGEPDQTSPIGKAKSRALHLPQSKPALNCQQRMLILDIWLRSGLPANDFAPLIGHSKHSLYAWRKRFEALGPAGLTDQPRGAPSGTRVNEDTRRAILMLKRGHEDWGVQRIHDVLLRSEGYSASPDAIASVLHKEGYVSDEEPTHAHEPKIQYFERAKPNQLWQTDLFTFVLKRENRRVHMVSFMDDHSRFIVGYGLHASALGGPVREVFQAAIANFGAPEEVLTDNGSQYRTWRGKSQFCKLCERLGINQIVATPRHPQTLGKVERFWGTLWRECLERAIFNGIDDARKRIGLFIDHYNFQRPHQGIGGHVPADRFFNAAPDVLATLKTRVAQNALDLARHGVPRKTVYLTGKVGDVGVSLHSEGNNIILMDANGRREEVNLGAQGRRAEQGEAGSLPTPVAVEGRTQDHPAVSEPASNTPGTSSLLKGLAQLRETLSRPQQPAKLPPQGGEA